jgi:ABC-2 type transport system ATP-binding protein
MRLLLGLDRPDGGEARIGGRSYRNYRFPLYAADAMLEAQAVHLGRSARNHLRRSTALAPRACCGSGH